MEIFKKLVTILTILILLNFLIFKLVKADDCPLDLSARVTCLEKKISETQNQEKSLSSEINLLDEKISLTRSQIDLTQQQLGRLTDDISSVSGKIGFIEDSLVTTSNILANRIAKTYMAGRADPVVYLLTAADFSDFWSRLAYLRVVQKHDQQLLLQMAATRKNYHDQKDLLEDKKKQIEKLSAQLKAYKITLDKQNREKQQLLAVTQNNEQRYQQFLSDARRELFAIQTSQFTSKKDVKKGEVIGLMGNTGFSFGAHLHFGVYNLTENQAGSFNYLSGTNNPLDYLRGRSLSMNDNACSDKHSGDNFGNGGWDWPMNNPTVSQCYGKTPFSSVYSNGLHEGFDMYDNADITVKAVDDGVAYFYRGSSALGNNVRVFHNNGKMTLYLHLQ